MNCPLCGEVCRCHAELFTSASSEWRHNPEDMCGPSSSFVPHSGQAVRDGLGRERFRRLDDARADIEQTGVASALQTTPPAEIAENLAAPKSAAGPAPIAGAVDHSADASAWRDELSARLTRYRVRRKAPPPRYPSLRLQFEPVESPTVRMPRETEPFAAFEPVSNHALALDGMRQEPSSAVDRNAQPLEGAAPERPTQTVHQPVAHAGAKIIEFPGFAWGPPVPLPDQLAEPVSDRPRILEVPEVAPPPPALGGITMEAVEPDEAERRPGIDIPLQSARLSLRLVAGLVDGVVIAAASVLFGFIFWKVVGLRPPASQVLEVGVVLQCLLWAGYQYLLIVYAGNTPGLRLAGLQLARFDGTMASRRLRRWRVLASYLSAVSLGMGYSWVLLDEDSLCWHDRITQTYLAPAERTKTR